METPKDTNEEIADRDAAIAKKIGAKAGSASFDADEWSADEAPSQVEALYAGGGFNTAFREEIPEWDSLPKEAKDLLENIAIMAANIQVMLLAAERDAAVLHVMRAELDWYGRDWDTDISLLAKTARKYVAAGIEDRGKMRDTIIREFHLDDDAADEQLMDSCEEAIRSDEEEKNEIAKDASIAQKLIKEAKAEMTFAGMVSKLAKAASIEDQYGDWPCVRGLLSNLCVGGKTLVELVYKKM